MINVNRVLLVGRLTKDVEVRKTTSGLSTARFNLAINRRFQKENETADFINCVAFKQSADFLGNYAHKGDLIAVSGHITTGSYQKDNQTIYTTDVTCEEVQLMPKEKKETHYEEQPLYQAPDTTWGKPKDMGLEAFDATANLSDELPF